MIMLSNVSSARDLGGRATETRLKYLNTYRFLVFVLVADLGFMMTTGSDYSPLYGYVSLAVQAKKQAELPEKPNVILIFTGKVCPRLW